MVEFLMTAGGFHVMVNGNFFGHLQKGEGFFTDATMVKKFLNVSSEDLVEIAKKADEVKKYGQEIPICEFCKGTPNFPNVILDEKKREKMCQTWHHPFNIRNFGRL